MKIGIRIMALVFALAGPLANAADEIPMEKVKTGILPSGGFYSMYEGFCHDRNVVSVVSLDRARRWCINAGGELSCVRQGQEAAHMACAQSGLALNQEPESMESIQ